MSGCGLLHTTVEGLNSGIMKDNNNFIRQVVPNSDRMAQKVEIHSSLRELWRLPIYRVGIASWISSLIFELHFRVTFSSWIFELDFRIRIFFAGFFWRGFQYIFLAGFPIHFFGGVSNTFSVFFLHNVLCHRLEVFSR